MTYQELVTKLIEIQKHMMPDLEKFEREDRAAPRPQGRQGRDHRVGSTPWTATAGLEDAPEIWPVEKFARALRDHYDDFNDFMRRNIAEYEVLAGQLPEAFAHPLGPVGSAAPPGHAAPLRPRPEDERRMPAGQSSRHLREPP